MKEKRNTIKEVSSKLWICLDLLFWFVMFFLDTIAGFRATEPRAIALDFAGAAIALTMTVFSTLSFSYDKQEARIAQLEKRIAELESKK